MKLEGCLECVQAARIEKSSLYSYFLEISIASIRKKQRCSLFPYKTFLNIFSSLRPECFLSLVEICICPYFLKEAGLIPKK
jgi:hypothetical protein